MLEFELWFPYFPAQGLQGINFHEHPHLKIQTLLTSHGLL